MWHKCGARMVAMREKDVIFMKKRKGRIQL